MAQLPIVMTTAGYVPQTPASLNALLILNVTAVNPGYTASLPGSLIEDISSTDTYALLECDSAFGELVNSITPFGANAFLLNQLGQVYGVQLGQPTNTSVNVVFSGPAGFVVVNGFIVSDGTYQYVVVNGGVVGASGTTIPLEAIANQTGTWSVSAGTVTQLVTSVPSTLSPPLTVNNPLIGTPSTAAETQTDYRARVLQAGLAASQGMGRYLKTLIMNVPGVQSQLVSVIQNADLTWTIVAGGGDPYATAYAIWQGLFDINNVRGALLQVSGITNANPGVVATGINHNFATGQVITIASSNPATFNGTYTITVLSQTTFSIGVNTISGFGAYIGGALVTPVLRNVSVSLNDYPDTYVIPFVEPPQQVVTMTVTWNTTSTNYVNPAAISQLAGPALVSYINGITVGQPINVDVMISVFQTAIAAILSTPLLTRLIFAVSINGAGASPVAGTAIILSDPSSYFFTTTANLSIVQG